MANQTRVCTQIGLQNWASDEFRMAVEYLQSGSLGHIEEIHAWTNRSAWPQSPIFSNDGRVSGSSKWFELGCIHWSC